MNIKQIANIEELKAMAGGNPQKIAEYAELKHTFEKVKSEFFNDDFPFADRFDEHHLDSLKKFSEENPENEDAQVRYALQKERFAVHEKNKNSHHERKFVIGDLRQKLSTGAVLNEEDLRAAERLAKLNPTTDNLVMYSTIKAKIS